MTLETLMQMRRSRYELSNRLPISEKQLTEMISNCILQAPSAFNMQSARVSLLLGEAHLQLWQMTEEILRALVPADKFQPTQEKLQSFAAAYGTILYWEHQPTIEQMQQRFAVYADNFPLWAQQANGMLQFAIWTVLAEAGVGASLQHYNPLIDERVREKFNISSDWQLVAQMPFGQATAPAAEKTFLPIEERLLIKR